MASGTVPIRAFLCGDKEFGICHVLDLGVVYNQFPNYQDNNPCPPVFALDEDDKCVRVSSSPNGRILEFRRGCARLVVWSNTKIVGGQLEYKNRNIYYSRQRNKLPNKNGQDPIYCPPENGLRTCCEGGNFVGRRAIGGPYLNCELTQDCLLECDENFKPQTLKFPLSNCEIESDGKRFLAGYAKNESWWYVDQGYISLIEDVIVENNPFDQIAWSPTMTIYAHFQVEYQPIKCYGDQSNGACLNLNSSADHKFTGSPCGGLSRTQALKDKENREKSVRITAAIGYSLGGCGYSPDKACEKTYDPTDPAKPFGNWLV